jgi:hypothetical protein
VDSIGCNYFLLRFGCQCHSRIDTPRLNLISFCPLKDSTRQEAGGRMRAAGIQKPQSRRIKPPAVAPLTETLIFL